MSNSLPSKEDIYEKIKKEKLTIHPLIWSLINDRLTNNIQAINNILGDTILDLLKEKPLSKENARQIISHGKALIEFFDKLENLTKPKS